MALLTPFIGVGDGCDAGGWRWWMSGGFMLCWYGMSTALVYRAIHVVIHTIGVASLTPFTGVDDGCDAGVWRWWMSGLVICVHELHMKAQC